VAAVGLLIGLPLAIFTIVRQLVTIAVWKMSMSQLFNGLVGIHTHWVDQDEAQYAFRWVLLCVSHSISLGQNSFLTA